MKDNEIGTQLSRELHQNPLDSKSRGRNSRSDLLERRTLLQQAGAFGLLLASGRLAPAYARSDAPASQASESAIDLTINDFPLKVNGRTGKAIAANGTVPGPLIRLREGQTAVIRVTNRLKEISSIHWHGVIVPPEMDGVPGVSFGGIKPGETFTYRFPVRQSGTYWCHSHSGAQELLGLYMPLLIEPIEPEPFRYDRDYVVLLSDWSFESPATIISKLKKQSGYFNYQKRTPDDFVRDTRSNGFAATVKERLSWSKMRMDPTDFADVTGYTYTYLLNGLTPEANWTGIFRPGETVRLRFIAAGAMTYFDIRIPGLKMSVVQADGQNVQPVEVDEFRIAAGETFDVLIHPEDRAYTLFAEAMDRSGSTHGTLAPRPGMSAAIPTRRPRPVRTMADMGMDMPGMDKKSTNMPGMDINGRQMQGMDMADKALVRTQQKRAGMEKDAKAGVEMPGMDMPARANGRLTGPSLPGNPAIMHGPDTHGVDAILKRLQHPKQYEDDVVEGLARSPSTRMFPTIRLVLGSGRDIKRDTDFLEALESIYVRASDFPATCTSEASWAHEMLNAKCSDKIPL